MKNKQKRAKESGKAQLPLLLAVALAAGNAGVWLEVMAATEVQRVVSRSIYADAGSA